MGYSSQNIRTSSSWLLVAMMMLAVFVSNGQTYLLVNDDLSGVESSPGVAIIYPRAIGPEIPVGNNPTQQSGLDDDILEAKESGLVEVTETAPVNTDVAAEQSTTTTASLPTTGETAKNETEPTTTAAAAAASTTIMPNIEPISSSDPTELPASASEPSSVYVPRPRSVAVQPKQQQQPTPASSAAAPVAPAPLNRAWHFNSRGVNSDAVWARVDRDSDAVESQPSPVYAQRTNSPVRQTFVRKPVFASAEPSLSNSLQADDGDLAVGEYPSNNQRNLYYPDINRIQAPGAAAAAAAASASASSSASSSANSNGFQAASSNIQAAYGTKGGGGPSPFLGNTWQPISAPAPVKAIRKVVKTSKTFQDDSQGFHSSQQPYRVRVVVGGQPQPQPLQQQQTKSPVVNQYFERLQDSRSSSSASASASAASSSSAFSKTIQTNQLADQKEFVEVNTKISRSGTKSPPPPPPAAIKSIPPAPVAVKSPPPPPPPPRPAPIRQATKTPPRAAIRAPVFEQETEVQQYEEHYPEPEPYSFNFNVNDDSGNGQFRREEGDKNGVVRGSYGYTDAWGLYRIVDYVADKNGFRASIRTNEPGLVERNPVTNEVDQPAHIQVAAEDTPAKVVELMRLKKPESPLI